MSRAYNEEQGRESNKERVNHRAEGCSSVTGWETPLDLGWLNRTVRCYIGPRPTKMDQLKY